MFIIEHGPDQEWFASEEEAINAALDWSVSLHGDTVTVSHLQNGKISPHMEVFV